MKERIQDEFIVAFKEKDFLKKDTLGILKTKISEWEKKNPNKNISTEDIYSLIGSEIKKREQAIELYNQNNSKQAKLNSERETKELEILKTFLPTQMSEQEILEKVNELMLVKADGVKPMQYLMSYFNQNLKGKFDNKILLKIINNLAV